MKRRADDPAWMTRAPMGRFVAADLWQVKTVCAKTGSERRVVGDQHEKLAPPRQGKHCARKFGAARPLAGTHNHHRTFRQRRSRRKRVGEPLVVGHQHQCG